MDEKLNIVLKNTITKYPYKSRARFAGPRYPRRDKNSHAIRIRELIQSIYRRNDKQIDVDEINCISGNYLEFSSAQNYDLKTKSLENRKHGVSLLNVHEDDNIIKATVYVPKSQEQFLLKQVREYQTEYTKKGNPKHKDLIESIENVKMAGLNSFWVGEKKYMPKNNKKWCEVWFRVPIKNECNIEHYINGVCIKLNIEFRPESIIFPERLVKLLFVSEKDLNKLIYCCEYLSEIRHASEPTSFFVKQTNRDQKLWNMDLINRTTYLLDGTSVCLLDTGLSNKHNLLEKATDDNHILAANKSWDAIDEDGHGTEMAGVALYFNLKEKIIGNEKLVITHEIESVKILPPIGENPIELYGAVTRNAISYAEIANPNANRVVCMAITASDTGINDGRPSSWSAVIDDLASGANEDNVKRLIILSAGNVCLDEIQKSGYPDANFLHSIEDPGQSWNAITVGAYSGLDKIDDDAFNGFKSISNINQLSPFSATSILWGKRWPIKPDVLFMGGNVATNGSDYTSCDDLSLLTTTKLSTVKQYETINSTSAAAAQAAWFAAQLVSKYPKLWPETIRALMVHSASWTEDMKKQFCKDDKKTFGRRKLLRTCGYGIPDLAKAIKCLNNSVNMIIEGELQPYFKNSMNEMHLHKIPWPDKLLLSMGNANVTLRVTLSYFIEPGPGEVGWKDRYRYASCGLRFDVKKTNESLEDFQKRINVQMRDIDGVGTSDISSGTSRWYLGPDNRDVGSIHSDMMIDINASDLYGCGYIAVYPVVGWWRVREYLKKSENKQRYSLIVTLSTPDEKVNLYDAIQTEIKNATEITL